LRTRVLHLDGRAVPYIYGTDCAQAVTQSVLEHCGTEILFVLDHRVRGHAAPVLATLRRHRRVEPFVVEATEPDKALSLVEAILEFATARRMTRDCVVVAMGGGLVGNVAGMAAAMLYRGTALIHLPTTPVAAFDSVLSLKQGVNLSRGKNLCGTYFAPSLVACDLAWLTTMPPAELRTGLAEMAKNVLAVVPEHEHTLLDAVRRLRSRPVEALARLCEIGLAAKAPMLARDPYEKTEALVFEYGHTVGHAIEFASAGRTGHGEAVAWGMLVAAEVSRSSDRLDDEGVDMHHRVLSELVLPPPREALEPIGLPALAALLDADNKRGYVPAGPDEVLMVLLDGPGRPVVSATGHPLTPVHRDVVLAAFQAVARGHSRGRAGVP
jgi:3-dehydroquinate synthase/2-deoxy-scyllo-inosose synthase